MNQKEFIKWADENDIDFEFDTTQSSGINGRVIFYKKSNNQFLLSGLQNNKTDWNDFKKELIKIL